MDYHDMMNCAEQKIKEYRRQQLHVLLVGIDVFLLCAWAAGWLIQWPAYVYIVIFFVGMCLAFEFENNDVKSTFLKRKMNQLLTYKSQWIYNTYDACFQYMTYPINNGDYIRVRRRYTQCDEYVPILVYNAQKYVFTIKRKSADAYSLGELERKICCMGYELLATYDCFGQLKWERAKSNHYASKSAYRRYRFWKFLHDGYYFVIQATPMVIPFAAFLQQIT